MPDPTVDRRPPRVPLLTASTTTQLVGHDVQVTTNPTGAVVVIAGGELTISGRIDDLQYVLSEAVRLLIEADRRNGGQS